MEITAGLHRVQAARQLERFNAMLAGCDVLDFGQSAALLAGRIEADLRRWHSCITSHLPLPTDPHSLYVGRVGEQLTPTPLAPGRLEASLMNAITPPRGVAPR